MGLGSRLGLNELAAGADLLLGPACAGFILLPSGLLSALPTLMFSKGHFRNRNSRTHGLSVALAESPCNVGQEAGCPNAFFASSLGAS